VHRPNNIIGNVLKIYIGKYCYITLYTYIIFFVIFPCVEKTNHLNRRKISHIVKTVLLILSCYTHSFGQVPFDCDGRGYRVLSADGGTYLQEIQQDDSDQTISFKNLHFYPDHEINAIAYHPSQNVIYGVMQTQPYRLVRIGADYNLDILQTLPLSAELVFVSGDISPDQQYLVLFGFGNTRNENIFALVDVEDGLYETQIVPMQTSNPDETYVYCADIAFHPTTGKLFGFDFRHDRLITLDIVNRLIDNSIYPTSKIVTGNVPSIFFSAQGELFGIGTTTQDSSHNRSYYQFDLKTGQGVILEELDIERNQDACSCPYRIKLLNEVRQRESATCTELAFEITLINKTKTEQFDLVLKDTFPENITIKSISRLPFDGSIDNSIGRNVLTIKDLFLPIGIFTIEILLNIDENTRLGDYQNQAILSGVRLEDTELNSVLSDDPLTAVPNDATTFSIDDLSAPFAGDFFGICRDGATTLHSGIYGARSYEWSTGENTESIVVHNEGEYGVTVTTECDQTNGIAEVLMDEVSLELGDDRTIENGESIILKPNYSSNSHIKSFHWQTSTNQVLDCPTCEKPKIQPTSDTEVHLWVENGSGCQTNDQLLLKVADIEFYTPNIFSPNNDNYNDLFFLQGNLSYDIAQLQIFDRWGKLQYRKKNITANKALEGWDGTHNGQECLEGVYIWSALIHFKNGQKRIISGDVTLIR